MKKILFVTLLAAVLIIAGCEEDNGSRAGEDPFIGGTQGLEMRYIDTFPPSSVLDQGEDEFNVIVELTNRGEADINQDDVRVTLTGFPTRSFGVTSDQMTKYSDEDIEKNEKNPDGSIIESYPVEVEFEGFNYEETVQGSQEFPFRAEVCYAYQTSATSSVCVKNDFRRDSEDADICTVASRKTVHNSGAPIQITNMEQTASGSTSTRLTFNVENVGSGNVYRPGEDCESESRSEDMVFVEVSGFEEAAGEELDCRGLRDGDSSSSGYLNIAGDGGEVSCTVNFEDRSPRIQNFNVDIGYDYEQSITKQVRVEHGS